MTILTLFICGVLSQEMPRHFLYVLVVSYLLAKLTRKKGIAKEIRHCKTNQSSVLKLQRNGYRNQVRQRPIKAGSSSSFFLS